MTLSRYHGLWTMARHIGLQTILHVMLTLAVIGHILVLLFGGFDALLSAYLGWPRLSTITRRLIDVIRTTWREDQQ